MGESTIEWTDVTWNPTRGCARVSPGCEHCYAERVAHRFSGAGQPYDGLTVLGKSGPRWSGRARFVSETLSAPLSWRKPRRIFVNSMSDLFHEDLTNEQIAAVFGVMAACPQHTFQVLTKRPQRMLEWFESLACEPHMELAGAADHWLKPSATVARKLYRHFDDEMGETDLPWPLPNVWLGLSCEDQQRAIERIPLLLRCPAEVRFVSAEPLLGPINLRRLNYADERELDALTGRDMVTHQAVAIRPTVGAKLRWVIVGGESGPSARPFHVDWARSVVDQCKAAGVAVFCKQLGANVHDRNDAGFDGDDGSWPQDTEVEEFWGDPSRRHQGAPCRVLLKHRKGGDMAEWPDALMVREFPGVHA